MVSLEEAHRACMDLRAKSGFDRLAARNILHTYFEERMSEALQKAFDAEPAPDGPPIPKSEA